jgi:hypothetical protein
MEYLEALRDARTQLIASGRNTLLYKVLTVQTDNKIDEIKKELLTLKKLLARQTDGMRP